MCTSDAIRELRDICLFPSHGVQEYPTEDMDEVHPGIFLGNAASAADIPRLLRHNIGHVLNAAHGPDASLNMVDVHPAEVYHRSGIAFLGIPALDVSSYPLCGHFGESSRFIGRGLRLGKGVLVHCRQGISRSAALVVAYLMGAEGIDSKEALRRVRRRREVLPNDGFLLQLSMYKPEEQ